MTKQKTLNGKDVAELQGILKEIEQTLYYIRENVDIIRTQTSIQTSKTFTAATTWGTTGSTAKQMKAQPFTLSEETAKYFRWDGAWKYDMLVDYLDPAIFTPCAQEFNVHGFTYSKKHHGFWKPKPSEGEAKQ